MTGEAARYETLNSSALLGGVVAAAARRLAVAGCDTPRLDAEVLLAHTLGQDRTWLYAHPQVSLDEAHINQFKVLLHRRAQREPVAYLVGHKEFFGLEFEVNPHVLIPRPETELLVEMAIKLTIDNCQLSIDNCSFSNLHVARPISIPDGMRSAIVDVGTGSGCIAVALAKHLPGVSITALDLSPEALNLAQQNAQRHGVAGRINFLLGDLLEPLAEPVDLIVSNPPYVSRSELAMAAPEVSRYEPRRALEGGDDGLDVVRRLLAEARSKLTPGGSLLIEIGSSQGQLVSQIAQKYFPQANIRLEQDLAGLDRLLVVRL